MLTIPGRWHPRHTPPEMGAWGVAIYSDDLACDVRDRYVDLLCEGLADVVATERLLGEMAEVQRDPDSAPVLWLALAHTQWRLGRLELRVAERALRVINDGSNLELWREQGLDVKRAAVLAKLKSQLTSPMPPRRRVSRRFVDATEWEVGEIIGYRLRSGRLVLFRVSGYLTDRGGRHPQCELLDWVGERVPPLSGIERLSVRSGWNGGSQVAFLATRRSEMPIDRVVRTGLHSTRSTYSTWAYAWRWRDVDGALENVFGVA